MTTVSMTADQENEYREEARRLKALPQSTQRQIIDIHLATANDPKATKADRRTARERAKALQRFLKLDKRS